MANCWSATRDPRIPGGASSALYMGTSIERAPTPRPPTNRPAIRVSCALPNLQDLKLTVDATDIPVSSNLDNGSDHEDNTPSRDGELKHQRIVLSDFGGRFVTHFSRKDIGEGTSDQSSHKGTKFENGGQESEGLSTFEVGVSLSLRVVKVF